MSEYADRKTASETNSEGNSQVSALCQYKQYLDMRNSQEYQLLQQFYHRKTIFDILGVSRQENPHSNFISWLLTPNENHGMEDYPLRRFLETICFAYLKYGKTYLNGENQTYKSFSEADRNKVDNNLLFFNSHHAEKEKVLEILKRGAYEVTGCYTYREYQLQASQLLPTDIQQYNFEEDHDEITSQNSSGSIKKRRADILIVLTISSRNVKYSFLILIENKVGSAENQGQTESYLKFLLDHTAGKGHINENSNLFAIPIYLYPCTNTELKRDAKNVNLGKPKCKSRLFLLLNYQYILDGVIAPCQTAYRKSPVGPMIDDYVSCLGKSLELQEEKKTVRYTPMAVSKEEKDWGFSLWQQHKEILSVICNEFFLPEEKKKYTTDDSKLLFYRTVFASVLARLEDREKDENTRLDSDEKDIALLKRALAGKVEYTFDGIKYRSNQRKEKSLGALGYNMIRIFVKASNASMPQMETIIRKELKSSAVVSYDKQRSYGPFLTQEDANLLWREGEQGDLKALDILRQYYLGGDDTFCSKINEKIDKTPLISFRASDLFGPIDFGDKRCYVWRWWSQDDIDKMRVRFNLEDRVLRDLVIDDTD